MKGFPGSGTGAKKPSEPADSASDKSTSSSVQENNESKAKERKIAPITNTKTNERPKSAGRGKAQAQPHFQKRGKQAFRQMIKQQKPVRPILAKTTTESKPEIKAVSVGDQAKEITQVANKVENSSQSQQTTADNNAAPGKLVHVTKGRPRITQERRPPSIRRNTLSQSSEGLETVYQSTGFTNSQDQLQPRQVDQDQLLKLSAYEQQIEDLTQQLNSEKTLRQNVEKAKHAMEAELHSARRLLEQTETDLQHHKHILDQSKASLSAQNALELQVEELKKKVKTKKAKIAKQKKKIKDLSGSTDMLEQANKNFDIVSKERDKLKESLQQAQATIARLQNEAKLQTDNSDAERKKLIAEIAQLKQTNSDLNNSMFNSNKELEDLRIRFKEEQALRKKYYNMIEDLKGSIRVFCRTRPIADEEIVKGHKNVRMYLTLLTRNRYVLLEMTKCL
jgi:hypothetical protein